MPEQQREVTTQAELVEAVGNTNLVVVASILSGLPTLDLHPGQALVGRGPLARLEFAPGVDGVRVSSDNRLELLQLKPDIDRCAVFNDTRAADLGRLVLRDLSVAGAVRIIAAGNVRGGHVEAHGIDIVAADARDLDERPAGYGVEVVAGAFTVWNRQTDPEVTIAADLTGLSAGRAGAPVHGSVFVGGAGYAGGRLIVRRMETDEVHCHGGIAPGTPDRISGGVFAVSGAIVSEVRNRGPATTYGPSDMVLDNWGVVDRWIAEAKLTSLGRSGIGFVNFGTLRSLRVEAPIETVGLGSRGFNVYPGSLHDAEFDRVVTHGDGAVDIQISKPVGRIAVRRGVETHGGVGDWFVKGVITRLAAIALSVKPGGSAREIRIDGGLVTHGEDVEPIELHGSVQSLRVTVNVEAAAAT